MAEKKLEKGALSIHTENIFPIIKKWLYSQHDIFLRELVSNAVDAIHKRKYADESFHAEDMKIEIKLDTKKKTLQVIDNGIGMTAEEVRKYINQIAFSGAEEFINRFKDVQSNIIGHFGLGFYSSFMVASKVTIDSLSHEKGAEPAWWECDGSTDYSLGKGKRKEVGTTITVHLSEEAEEYNNESKITEILERYCNFMPVPIMFAGKQVNQKEALWNKNPKDLSPEDYKNFYKEMFHDYYDPVFWIHLNVDYPFNLKGILFFPKLRNDLEMYKGKVRVFCNNVFVAENLEDLLPEFLLLLKGGIDIPDIPLNVSRSFLQNDKQVQKISKYIVKKVADLLNDTFKEDRKKYEEYWEDISTFIKYGMLRDEDFCDAMKDKVIFKTAAGDYVTIEEYKLRNNTEGDTTKIWYSSGENTQVSFLNLMKEQGLEVVFQNSPIDTHFYEKLEQKLEKIEFVRIDSEINDMLLNKDEQELADRDNITDSEKIKEIFNKALNPELEASFSDESLKEYMSKFPQAATVLSPFLRKDDSQNKIKPYDLPQNLREELGNEAMNELWKHVYIALKVDVKSLKTKEIPTMIVFNEFIRRMHDKEMLNNRDMGDMLRYHTLVVNQDNPVVKKISALDAEGKKDEANTLCSYLHDLSLLEQKPFNGKELQDFVQKANKILNYIN